jgi:hypothetical protein
MGTEVWAARYTGKGLTSVFYKAVVQSVAASVLQPRYGDERLVVVKFDDDGSVHMVPHYLVFPSRAKPSGRASGHARTAAREPLFQLDVSQLCTPSLNWVSSSTEPYS